MRVILGGPGEGCSGELSDPGLAAAYAYPPRQSWWRANMISSLDGAATGRDGLSGSLHTPADNHVFGLLRALADVVVVAAGTARDEGYGPLPRPGRRWRFLREGRSAAPALVVVSGSGHLPGGVVATDREVYLATATDAEPERLAAARDLVGADRVLLVGERGTVDAARLRDRLDAAGLRHVLLEGGPVWLRRVVADGALDELCLTMSPCLVAGDGPRILTGGPIAADIRPTLLLEDDGTLLGRWTLRR